MISYARHVVEELHHNYSGIIPTAQLQGQVTQLHSSSLWTLASVEHRPGSKWKKEIERERIRV